MLDPGSWQRPNGTIPAPSMKTRATIAHKQFQRKNPEKAIALLHFTGFAGGSSRDDSAVQSGIA
jgi:hypothetical protein